MAREGQTVPPYGQVEGNRFSALPELAPGVAPHYSYAGMLVLPPHVDNCLAGRGQNALLLLLTWPLLTSGRCK